jgi:hypothetical protein
LYGIFAYALKKICLSKEFSKLSGESCHNIVLYNLAEQLEIPLPGDWLLDLLLSRKNEWGFNEGN